MMYNIICLLDPSPSSCWKSTRELDSTFEDRQFCKESQTLVKWTPRMSKCNNFHSWPPIGEWDEREVTVKQHNFIMQYNINIAEILSSVFCLENPLLNSSFYACIYFCFCWLIYFVDLVFVCFIKRSLLL